MSTQGWWKVDINIWDDEDDEKDDYSIDPNETDLEHIGEMIAQGCTQGEICHDE